MVTTFLLSLLVTIVNQAVKLLSRFLGVSKEVAIKVVLSIGFVLSIAFTVAQNYGLFSTEQMALVATIFISSIGSYEILLKRTGLDSLMKDAMELKRGKKD